MRSVSARAVRAAKRSTRARCFMVRSMPPAWDRGRLARAFLGSILLHRARETRWVTGRLLTPHEMRLRQDLDAEPLADPLLNHPDQLQHFPRRSAAAVDHG